MAYIYLITNKINGKQYVGKTENTIDERWREHCNDYQREHCEKRPLYNAMIKYGIDNFEIKELEYLEQGGKLLSDRETYWIEKLNTYGHTGYNATKGGDGTLLYNPQGIIELYSKYKTITKVAEILDCDHYTISRVLNANNINVKERKTRCKPKVVEQYSLDNKLLNTFESCYQAGQYLKNIVETSSDGPKIGRNIGRCANGERKTAYGFIWKFKQN